VRPSTPRLGRPTRSRSTTSEAAMLRRRRSIEKLEVVQIFEAKII
jgi:hypothetical protein